MNSEKKILISHQAYSRKTPKMASAVEHSLRKRLKVFLLIQVRSNNFVSSPQTSIMIFSLCVRGRSSFSCACLYTATEQVNF